MDRSVDEDTDRQINGGCTIDRQLAKLARFSQIDKRTDSKTDHGRNDRQIDQQITAGKKREQGQTCRFACVYVHTFMSDAIVSYIQSLVNTDALQTSYMHICLWVYQYTWEKVNSCTLYYTLYGICYIWQVVCCIFHMTHVLTHIVLYYNKLVTLHLISAKFQSYYTRNCYFVLYCFVSYQVHVRIQIMVVTHIQMHAHTSMHTYVHAYIHPCIHTCRHTYIPTYIRIQHA